MISGLTSSTRSRFSTMLYVRWNALLRGSAWPWVRKQRTLMKEPSSPISVFTWLLQFSFYLCKSLIKDFKSIASDSTLAVWEHFVPLHKLAQSYKDVHVLVRSIEKMLIKVLFLNALSFICFW